MSEGLASDQNMDHAVVNRRRRSPAAPRAGRPGYNLGGRVGYLWLEDEPAPTPVRILWLSPVGATLISDFRADLTLGERVRVLLAIGDDCPLEGHVIEVRRGPTEGVPCQIRVSFSLIPASTARWVLAFLRGLIQAGEGEPPPTVEREVKILAEPDEIDRYVSGLYGESARAWVRRGNEAPRPGRLEPDGSLLVRWDGAPATGGPLEVEACGYNSVYQFHVGHPTGGFRRLTRLVSRRHRWHRRVRAPSRLKMSVRHPLWPEVHIQRRVHDVSFSGLAFETDALDDLLYPGLVLHDLEVAWKGGRRLTFSAIVRHVSDRPDAHGQLCGVELLIDPSEEAGAEWCDEVSRLMHPLTGLSSGWDDDVWALYGESGYFSLSDKSPDDFSDQRRAFAQASDKLRGDPEVGFRIDCVGETRVEASISQVQAWSGSWVVYQLARHQVRRPLSMSGEQVLRDLYLHAYERLQRTSGARWLVSYVQDVARFSRLLHYDLTAAYTASGRSDIRGFWAMQGDTAPREGRTGKYEIGLATPEELEQLGETIVEQRSELYRAGTGLDRPGLEMDAISHRWKKAGLGRERAILVARRSGFMVAAAVCEFAEEGVHLYGLLDCVRLFALVPAARAVYPELLEAARAWYRSRGKKRFVYFVDADDDPQQALDEGFVDMGKAYTLVLPIDLLPELLERVYAVTARRMEVIQ